MAVGQAGADSSSPVSTTVQGKNLVELAYDQFGEYPVLWGRYFTSASTTGSIEYRHAQENPILAQYNIRLLPVARQTTHVGGSQQQGTTDAQNNAQDVIDTFGADYLASQGGQFMMFLDVEGSPSTGSPSLSVDYYNGWAQTLIDYSLSISNETVTILPCVYARQGDNDTWNALVTADNQGSKCYGAWAARYYYSGCSMHDWSDSIVQPSVALPFDVLLWQYAENCAQGTIDCNQTNPNVDIETALLQKLILPPAST
jgi:hypothetical protein